MRDADGGDFQVHRASANTLVLQFGETVRALVVEGQDGELRKTEEAVQESAIRESLPQSRGFAMDASPPALGDFLRCDDCDEKSVSIFAARSLNTRESSPPATRLTS